MFSYEHWWSKTKADLEGDYRNAIDEETFSLVVCQCSAAVPHMVATWVRNEDPDQIDNELMDSSDKNNDKLESQFGVMDHSLTKGQGPRGLFGLSLAKSLKAFNTAEEIRERATSSVRRKMKIGVICGDEEAEIKIAETLMTMTNFNSLPKDLRYRLICDARKQREVEFQFCFYSTNSLMYF